MTNQSYFHGFSPSLSRISVYRETTTPANLNQQRTAENVGIRPLHSLEILSYMGIPCSAVARFMGVIAQVGDLFIEPDPHL